MANHPKMSSCFWLYDSMTLLKKRNPCPEETKVELLEDDQPLLLLLFLTFSLQCPEIWCWVLLKTVFLHQFFWCRMMFSTLMMYWNLLQQLQKQKPQIPLIPLWSPVRNLNKSPSERNWRWIDDQKRAVVSALGFTMGAWMRVKMPYFNSLSFSFSSVHTTCSLYLEWAWKMWSREDAKLRDVTIILSETQAKCPYQMLYI